MTTNAATLLASRLRGWHVPAGEYAEASRGFRDATDLDAWRRFVEDGDLVRAVDSTLQGMSAAGEDVDMFLEALPRWYAAMYMATTPWRTAVNNNRFPCEGADINLLAALGRLIAAGKPIDLSEDDRRSLSDVLEQAGNLLREDTSDFPEDVRRYLWGLVVRAQMIVENFDRYGHEAVRQVAFELGGALTTQAEIVEKVDQERASRWRSAALLLMGGFLGQSGASAANAVLEAGQQVVKGQLGG